MVMTDHSEIQPVTHKLSHILFAIAFVYLLINLVVLAGCASRAVAEQSSGICTVTKPFQFLENIISAIWRPVAYLEQHENHARAELVSRLYSFSWGSAVLAALLMIAVQIIFLRCLTETDRRATAEYLSKIRKEHPKDLAALGIRIIQFLTFFAFMEVFSGFLNMSGGSIISSAAHNQDVGLYRIGLLFSFLLMCFMAFLTNRVGKACEHESPRGQVSS